MGATYFGDPAQQAVLERIKAGYPTGIFDSHDVMPFTIVSELVMGTNNQYQFAINDKNMPKATLPLCSGLLDSDLFFGFRMAILVSQRLSTKPFAVKYYQFGNPDVFTGTGYGVAADIEAFYTSKYDLIVSNNAMIQNTWTQPYLKVPFASTNVVAAPISTTGGAAPVANTNNYCRETHYVPTTIVSLLGGDQNSVNLTLTVGATPPDVVNTQTNGQNVVSIFFDGFRIPNGANAFRALNQK